MAVLHLVLMLAFPLALAALIGAGLWLRAWGSTRRAASRARKILSAGGDAEAGIEVLRGRLVVEGALEDDLRSRGQAGAATAWLSKGRAVWSQDAHFGERKRARSLVIVAPDREVAIDEAVMVVAGSEVRWPGQRVSSAGGHASLAWATVTDGDEVLALGRLQDEAREAVSGADHYRTPASHEVLARPTPAGIVEIAAVAEPAVHITTRQVATHPWVVLALVAGCYFTGGAFEDYYALVCTDMCSDSGACDVAPHWLHRSALTAVTRWFDNDHFECSALDDRSCRTSKGCAASGKCTARAGDCTVATRADCLHTDRCLRYGQCTPRDGTCRASGEDCRHTDDCIKRGQCTGSDDGCIATTDEQCAASMGCVGDGACALLDGGTCGATRDEHCTPTYQCRFSGACTARDGACVPTDENCRGRGACRDNGFCHSRGGLCRAGSRADCLQSRSCAEYRRCRVTDGVCQAEDAPTCRASAACKVHGHCDGDSSCSATTEQDCQASERCTTHGECRLLSGTCVKTCADSWLCQDGGRCAEQDGACIAGSNADCAASYGCQLMGWCTERRGFCEVGAAKDCHHTPGCRFRGECSNRSSSCLPTTSDDCRRTLDCELKGNCTLEGRRCLAAGDDCRSTRACQERGACGAVDGECQAVSDEDCAASEVCKRNGWCQARQVEGTLGTIHACFAGPPTAS